MRRRESRKRTSTQGGNYENHKQSSIAGGGGSNRVADRFKIQLLKGAEHDRPGTTGLNGGWSNGESFSGSVWTVDIGLISNTFPLNTRNFYEVDIYLVRPETAVGVCNASAYGAYTEEIIS